MAVGGLDRSKQGRSVCVVELYVGPQTLDYAYGQICMYVQK